MNKDKKPLSITHPELLTEWDYSLNRDLSPDSLTAGSGKRIWWKCKLGHSWQVTVKDRITDQTRCPFCLNRRVLSGFNDLASKRPDLAKEWHPTKNGDLKPDQVLPASRKKVWWKSDCGHEWQAYVYSRKSGAGCSVCHNKTLLVGFNDLESKRPDLAKEWHPTKNGDLKPNQIFDFARKSYWWKCSLGHEWKASVYHRIKQNCPYCSNRKILRGFNDLATTHPEISRDAFGWDPKTVFAGSLENKKWKCEKGHVWKTQVQTRKRGRGCPTCATYGFDPNDKGYLYFLIQPKWELYQIGITNFPEQRLDKHRKNGFEVIDMRGPIDGHAARNLETAILRFLKTQKADLSPDSVAGKFDGYSESWTVDSFKVNNLKELIDKATEAGY